MPDERTCRTCWHWGVIEPGQGLCGHPDTGGAVHGADDTCCNRLAIVGRGGDWQPHEQLSGGSSPAGDWAEPMVDMGSSSNPPEAHVAKHLLTGGLKPEDVEPDGLPEPPPDPLACAQAVAERDLLKQRVAELEAELENERRRVAELSRDNWNLHVALSVAEAEMQPTEVCPACNGDVPWGKPGICYLCGNMGVVTKERLLRIDAFRQCEAVNKRLRQVRRWAAAWKRAAKRLAVGFLNERRAVEALAEQCASQKPQRMPWMGCPVPAPDGYPGCLLGGRRPDCVRCWSEWAREQAREEAAKTGTTQKGNG